MDSNACAQETCTNQKLVKVVWYKKLARVSANLVQVFLVQVSCTQ